MLGLKEQNLGFTPHSYNYKIQSHLKNYLCVLFNLKPKNMRHNSLGLKLHMNNLINSHIMVMSNFFLKTLWPKYWTTYKIYKNYFLVEIM